MSDHIVVPVFKKSAGLGTYILQAKPRYRPNAPCPCGSGLKAKRYCKGQPKNVEA